MSTPDTTEEQVVETRGDERHEILALDTTGSGTPDIWAIDTDGNGKADLFQIDTDGDGRPDRRLVFGPRGRLQRVERLPR